MKVYSTPVPFAGPDYSNYDSKAEQNREAEHQDCVAAWLRNNGYVGPRTGQLLHEPMADGYAAYMYGDAPKNPCLIHLPYGDAWHSPNVQHLPKGEVLLRLDRGLQRKAMFS